MRDRGDDRDGWRGGFIIPLFFIGVAAGRLTHLAFPGTNEVVLMAAFMAATNTGVTKTPLGSTLVVTQMAGLQLLPTTLIAAVVALLLTSEVGPHPHPGGAHDPPSTPHPTPPSTPHADPASTPPGPRSRAPWGTRERLEAWGPMTPAPPLSMADYQALAGFRRGLREFLHFSEEASRAEGVAPSQHQLLLAIKAMPPTGPDRRPPSARSPTGSSCATTRRSSWSTGRPPPGLVTRVADPDDARCQRLHLTAKGEEKLARLSELHREELRRLREETFAHLLSLG